MFFLALRSLTFDEFGGQYGIPGMESALAMSKANILPVVLLLQP